MQIHLPPSGLTEAVHGFDTTGAGRSPAPEGGQAAEEDLRLKVRPGTKQALTELMAWAGIEEQGEAMTLMIHHLHALGPIGALPLLEPPRH